MSEGPDNRVNYIYEGIWGVLAGLMRVPRKAPTLPLQAGERVDSFRPAPGFLRYLKLKFWLLLVLMDGVILLLWGGLTAAEWQLGIIVAPIALALAILPDILVWIGIHLRYDTTWYVLGSRSMRIRRGIWTVRDISITFENVQNVRVTQGPIQRYFGIADLRVDTAGGGAKLGSEGAMLPPHAGIIEGVSNAKEIQALILGRLGKSRDAGLGDSAEPQRQGAWTTAHTAALCEIRDVLRKEAGRAGMS